MHFRRKGGRSASILVSFMERPSFGTEVMDICCHPPAATRRCEANAVKMLLFVALLVIPATTNGQPLGASVTGAIVDASGASLADSVVTIAHLLNGRRQQIKTSTSGIYRRRRTAPGQLRNYSRTRGVRPGDEACHSGRRWRNDGELHAGARWRERSRYRNDRELHSSRSRAPNHHRQSRRPRSMRSRSSTAIS
jgi:hypothetical protein